MEHDEQSDGTAESSPESVQEFAVCGHRIKQEDGSGITYAWISHLECIPFLLHMQITDDNAEDERRGLCDTPPIQVSWSVTESCDTKPNVHSPELFFSELVLLGQFFPWVVRRLTMDLAYVRASSEEVQHETQAQYDVNLWSFLYPELCCLYTRALLEVREYEKLLSQLECMCTCAQLLSAFKNGHRDARIEGVHRDLVDMYGQYREKGSLKVMKDYRRVLVTSGLATCAGCRQRFQWKFVRRCKGCMFVRYCSFKCQHDDWKTHKPCCTRYSLTAKVRSRLFSNSLLVDK